MGWGRLGENGVEGTAETLVKANLRIEKMGGEEIEKISVKRKREEGNREREREKEGKREGGERER